MTMAYRAQGPRQVRQIKSATRYGSRPSRLRPTTLTRRCRSSGLPSFRGDAAASNPDTGAAIHLKRHTYDPQEPLTPWVHAIARYKLIDFLRHDRMSLAALPLDEASEVMAVDDSTSAESTFDLRRLMKHLPERTQCAIEAVK